MQYRKMKVWRPDGSVEWVETIASDWDHYGNAVAEGRLQEHEFWPTVYSAARREAKRNRLEYVALRNRVEREAYARGWVPRWLEHTYWQREAV